MLVCGFIAGKVKCPTCDGMCRLKHFLQLTVTWTNHVDNYVLERSDLPDHLITGAQGDTVFEYAALRVPPIKYVPCLFPLRNSYT